MIRPLPRNITTRPEKLVTSHLIRLINSWRVQPSSIGVTFAIPKFDEEDVTLLISEATRLLKMQHSVVKKKTKLYCCWGPPWQFIQFITDFCYAWHAS